MVELLGIGASCMVLFSFLFNEPRKIRSLNLVGALLFVVYGCLISSPSTCFLNAALAFVHMCYLLRKEH